VSIVEYGRKSASAKGLGRWLSRIAPGSARGTVTVAIVSDAKIKSLNHRYLGIDKATDVLSFPANEGARGKGPLVPSLGDIVIARGLARKQARILGHSEQAEFRVLALHGLLHLLGYDHEVDAGEMARVEARLRREAGLPRGLIARSSRAARLR
jgi:probable rRNA maturation factor